jgi:hypothetical protein
MRSVGGRGAQTMDLRAADCSDAATTTPLQGAASTTLAPRPKAGRTPRPHHHAPSSRQKSSGRFACSKPTTTAVKLSGQVPDVRRW